MGATIASAATAAASTDSAHGVSIALDGPIDYFALAIVHAIHLDQHRGLQAVDCIVKHEERSAAQAVRQRPLGCKPWYSHPFIVSPVTFAVRQKG